MGEASLRWRRGHERWMTWRASATAGSGVGGGATLAGDISAWRAVVCGRGEGEREAVACEVTSEGRGGGARPARRHDGASLRPASRSEMVADVTTGGIGGTTAAWQAAAVGRAGGAAWHAHRPGRLTGH